MIGLLAYGPTESFLPEQFTKLLEVNLVGPQRVNRIVVPHMRRKGRGVLIFVSSASVYGSSAPFAGAYFASKAAVDSLAQVYQLELSPFGIETSIILPGFFPTGTNIFAAALRPGDTQRAEELWSPPSPLAGWDAVLQESGRKLLSPEARPQAVADAIDRVINAEHGKRPFRAIIEYDGGQTEISAGVHDLVRDRYLTRFGFGELLKPKN
jgi:NAD(P)-dependent dehydrogenase (short-subunit alcohol dehydrogenase family)